MIKTLKLTANAETSISGLGGDRVRIQNRMAGTLYVSGSPGIAPCADGVMSIPAGRGDYFPYSMTSDTIYLLSAAGGDVELSGEHYYRPFDDAAVSGGVAVGNPVVMDGLQGGVPFPEITVSGKNLLKYPYYETTKTQNGITFTAQSDGGVKISGTLESGKSSAFTLNRNFRINGAVCISGGSKNIRLHLNTVDNRSFWDNGNGAVVSDVDVNYVRIFVTELTEPIDTVIYPQIETGSTPTAYEPPITGRELTIHACGKNLIKYPYTNSEKTENGITFTSAADGSITVNGTAEKNASFTVDDFRLYPAGNYVLSPNGVNNANVVIIAYKRGFVPVVANVNGGTFTLTEPTEIRITVSVWAGNTAENSVVYPQLEVGADATPYKQYSGTQYTITPDSNPYSVPDDIRQQDGMNNVSVSAGELTVEGVYKNHAIKKIWDKIDELTTAIIVSTSDLSE